MTTVNLLHEFFNSKSDANQFLDATQQEQLEKDFHGYINGEGERKIISVVNEMCEQSLHPEAFEKWDEVKASLKAARTNLAD